VAAVGTWSTDASQSISAIKLYMRGLRCLRETGGPVPLASEIAGSDEIVARVSFIRASDGKKAPFEKSLDGMDSGSWKFFSSQLCVDGWPDPGAYIDITGQLLEDDPSPIGSTGTVDMGTHTLTISRAELLRCKGRGQVPRTLPLFRGGGGEYALTVAIEVL
jgi:hypothetical protein